MINHDNNHQSASAAPKTTRRRLTPAEQIQAAKAALQRAQRRQRAHDTRSKIVLGGFVLSWARSNRQAAQALLQHMNAAPPRAQDVDALVEVRNELIQIVRNTDSGVGGNSDAQA